MVVKTDAILHLADFWQQHMLGTDFLLSHVQLLRHNPPKEISFTIPRGSQ